MSVKIMKLHRMSLTLVLQTLMKIWIKPTFLKILIMLFRGYSKDFELLLLLHRKVSFQVVLHMLQELREQCHHKFFQFCFQRFFGTANF